MPEPIPLGLTRRLPRERAIASALLVNIPFGGYVDTVFTFADHLRVARRFLLFFLVLIVHSSGASVSAYHCPLTPRLAGGLPRADRPACRAFPVQDGGRIADCCSCKPHDRSGCLAGDRPATWASIGEWLIAFGFSCESIEPGNRVMN